MNELKIYGHKKISYSLVYGERSKPLALKLIRSIGFIIEFVMKLSSLVSLISSIVFEDLFFGVETIFGFVNEV